MMDIQSIIGSESRRRSHGGSPQITGEVDSGLGPDQRDMLRMGKVQELRVRPLQLI